MLEPIDINLVTKELQNAGYSPEEIKKIIKGSQDIRDGKMYTAEAVYKFYFHQQEAYA